MTNDLSEDQIREVLRSEKPDVIGCTAITPAIYKAERLLQIAKEVNPAVVTVLGGIHGTFMYPQVLKEAPWIDAVVRGALAAVPGIDEVALTTNGHGLAERARALGLRRALDAAAQ